MSKLIPDYEMCIRDRKKAMDGLDTTSDLYKTYAAQLKVLEDYPVSYTHLDVYKRQGRGHGQCW